MTVRGHLQYKIIQEGVQAMSQWHSKTTKEVLDQLKVTAESGLTDSEVKKRLEQYGPNELKSAEKESLFMRFLDQMKDPMIIVLLVAAVLSFVSSGFTDWVDSVIILLIVTVLRILIPLAVPIAVILVLIYHFKRRR